MKWFNAIKERLSAMPHHHQTRQEFENAKQVHEERIAEADRRLAEEKARIARIQMELDAKRQGRGLPEEHTEWLTD